MRRPSEKALAIAGGAQSDDSHLAAQLQRVVVVRLAAVASFLLSFFLLRVSLAEGQGALLAGNEHSVDGLIYMLLIGAVLLSLGFFAQLQRRRPALRTQALLHFSSDLLLTTALVYLFGGASSPFSSLFFIIIILATAFLGRKTGLGVATAAWILYAIAALARHGAWLPGALPSEESLTETAYRLGLHLLGFLLVALLTSRLARELSRAESDLAALRVVHRDIVESIPSGLITFDPDGIVVTANAAAPRILGRDPESFAGRHVSDTGLFVETPWQEFVEPGPSDLQRHEVTYERDGEQRPIGFSLTELTSEHGELSGFVLIFQDLYKLHQMQEELQLKDRMAAVGEMAAGIAHEIGNPLAALSGSAQMLQQSLAAGSSQRKLLDIILRESRRLDRIIKSFLQFSRPRERASVRFDIAELLRNNTELLCNSEEVLPGHRVHLELDRECIELIADPDQISQIFWNLTRNALRAMDSVGDLYVQGELADDSYNITIKDTGRGMSADDQAQLFYPFHTSFHGGTGIGMAIVYRIVEEHGGRLTVDSKPGAGTTITVTLPAVESLMAATP